MTCFANGVPWEPTDCTEISTTADRTLYVDNVNGSDSVGSGTAANPYFSVGKAWNQIKCIIIRHAVRILCAKTGVDYDCRDIDLFRPMIRGDGFLSIIGVGTPNIFAAGPYTLTAVSTPGINAGVMLTAGAAAWPVDNFYGKWARMLDGTCQNFVYGGFKNDATHIWGCYYTDRPLVGDTFDIVYPAVKLNFDHLTIDLSECLENWDDAAQNSRLSFCNLEIDFSLTTKSSGNMVVRGPGTAWLDFVRILLPSGVTEPIMFFGTNPINFYLPMDTNLMTLSESLIGQIGTDECAGVVTDKTEETGPEPTLTDIACYGSMSRLHQWCFRGNNLLYENSSMRLQNCCAGQLEPFNSDLIANNCLINGGAAGISLHVGSFANLYRIFILSGTSAIRITLSNLALWQVGCSSTLTGFDIEVNAISQIAIKDNCAGMVAAGGDIRWLAPNPDVTVAWPAVDGAFATDGLGSYVTHQA